MHGLHLKLQSQIYYMHMYTLLLALLAMLVIAIVCFNRTQANMRGCVLGLNRASAMLMHLR
jgi:hypothetical protein